jgi:hypothetical protein
MRIFATLLLLLTITAFRPAGDPKPQKNVVLTKAALKNKIKGGWAGQTIGVTFGWPTEFNYLGTFIQDYQTIVWNDDYVVKAMDEFPGLYDDIYMDLTFVDVFEKYGLTAPADSFANAYAHADYQLWHANQAGRYNILNGVPAGKSGHWLNNPHADDIDFQIESDFAGLMSPAMPNVASEISDRIGHIMNSGDGWYGGVYVSNMYALAFASSDVNYIVTEALKSIPEKSQFYKCVADVIRWHKQYPSDWKQNWFEIQRKWAEEAGCPDGVFRQFDIDAKLNAAYVVLGLLYGEGDFTKTMEIATRAGQDSDCNPSTAGGVLGTVLGYDKIPAYWLNAIKKAEDKKFSHTDLSLNKVYEMGYKHALLNIEKNKGKVEGDQVVIPFSAPKPVRFEENFTGHYPKQILPFNNVFQDKFNFSFDGVGFVLRGYARVRKADAPAHTLQAALYIDGKEVEKAKLPVYGVHHRTDLFWRYQLPKGVHQVEVKILNPHADYELQGIDCLVYDDKPTNGIRK